MSVLADFSLNNLQIKQYFNGSDDYVPTSELLYVHTHPLVRPNFLSEIEVLINKASQVMVERNITGVPVQRFTALAQELGRQLPELTEKNAPAVLNTLREIYKLCNTVIGKR